jgi:hypothetical protein
MKMCFLCPLALSLATLVSLDGFRRRCEDSAATKPTGRPSEGPYSDILMGNPFTFERARRAIAEASSRRIATRPASRPSDGPYGDILMGSPFTFERARREIAEASRTSEHATPTSAPPTAGSSKPQIRRIPSDLDERMSRLKALRKRFEDVFDREERDRLAGEYKLAEDEQAKLLALARQMTDLLLPTPGAPSTARGAAAPTTVPTAPTNGSSGAPPATRGAR